VHQAPAENARDPIRASGQTEKPGCTRQTPREARKENGVAMRGRSLAKPARASPGLRNAYGVNVYCEMSVITFDLILVRPRQAARGCYAALPKCLLLADEFENFS
jgi:hypothetical protein